MDRQIDKGAPLIPLRVDIGSGVAYYRDELIKLGPREASMLDLLVTRYAYPVPLRKLHTAVGGAQNFGNVRKRLMEKLAEHGIILDYVPGKSIRLDGLTPEALPQPAIDLISFVDPRPLFTEAVASGGLSISIDGIVLNAVSEVLYNCVDRDTIMACPRLYRSAIEDLAFALVYGTKLSSKWRPREEAAKELGTNIAKVPQEAAAILISQLEPGFYDSEVEDERFRYGRVLNSEQSRRQIGQYMTSLGKAVAIPYVKELCREWLVREANQYLGEDPSLFGSNNHGDQPQFRKVYYDSPFLNDIPSLLGDKVIEMFIDFLPKAPSGEKNADHYSRTALRQFVLQSTLTHITTMYEYEQIAEGTNRHRLPFMLRGAVKIQWHKDYETESELRTLLVRSALHEGLREAEDAYGRDQLVKRLLWVREKEEFVQMRRRLELLGTLSKEERKTDIAELLRELRSGGPPKQQDAINKMGISRNSILPRIEFKPVEPSEYMRRLAKLFPEFICR